MHQDNRDGSRKRCGPPYNPDPLGPILEDPEFQRKVEEHARWGEEDPDDRLELPDPFGLDWAWLEDPDK